MEATIELLSDPDAIERIRAADEDIAAGTLISQLDMAELMTKRRAASQLPPNR